jgi:signal transduction histidine kinase/PAS domain-containing protein
MLCLTDWKRFLSAVPEPALLLADDGTIATANPGFAALIDRTTDRLAGEPLSHLAHEGDRSALEAALAAPGRRDIEIRVTEPNRGLTLALSIGDRVGDRCRLVLARPVRAEERSQRQLLQYFRDAIDSVGHMVAILDADDRMIAHNRNYREGYRVGDRDLPADVDLVGRTYRECMELRAKYKLHREYLDQPSKFVEERMRQHHFDRDQTITLANGQTLKVEKRTLPHGVRVIVGTDITEIVEGERKRRDLEAQLHHSQKLEALGTLAGGIAHDLNNTLVPIVALSKSMARRLPEGSRDRTSLELVIQAADRARDLAGRILTFSRKEQVQHKLVDLNQVVGQGIKLLRSLVPTTIDLVSELPPVPPVMGDPGQCYQVLVNLVSNASRAIGTGPGTIVVGLASDASTASVVLSVQDSGCGMDEPTQRRIFEPFYTTRKVGEGTGLGLSVVHGIVTSHGGSIEVKSALGEGTTFVVRFPRASEAAMPEAPAA